ncbi:MAG: TonB-dependent receptor [Rhodoferax sp.]|nr:TonB-dependent receptor [Rhodoferax sp.]MCF8208957.1 TonB-dependent receptor [Rhodoferax sp.]
MKPLKPSHIALAVAAVCSSPLLWAQQTVPTDVGRIAVDGLPGGTGNGLIIQEDTPKARSTVNKAHLDGLNPSNNPYQALELLPGVNTFSHDATGLYGGGLRVRGANSDQMGFTINGAPVNDSGSFSVFPQEYTDTDNLCELFVTQGSTDSEAPHVGASGGNVGMVTCAPSDEFAFQVAQTLGNLAYSRTFLRLNTGKFADGRAKAFISYSKSRVDKFKGPGRADRNHLDLGAQFQPTSNLMLSTSLLYNNAVNNNYRTLTRAQIAASGSDLDFSATPPQHLAAVNGTAQVETAPANGYYEYNINPFKNYLWAGKAEYKVSKEVSIAAEPYYWYGFGTGGSQLATLQESNAGSRLGGGIRDINGDGDTLDTAMVYRSSVTETFRPGITLKTNTRIGSHNLLAGYWFERARHFQTQPAVRFDNFGNAADRWLENENLFLLRQNGTAYQGRDQLTSSTATSLFLQDSVNLMQDKLGLQVGLRSSEIRREYTNFANEGGGQGADYSVNKSYSKLLPSVGLRYNLDAQQQVFFNLADNWKAPGNFSYGGLLSGGTTAAGVLTGAKQRVPSVEVETSTNLDLGYRFAGDALTVSGSVYYNQFKNRIARAWDPVAGLNVDYNVGDVIIKGFELESGVKLSSTWSLYGSLSYTDAVMQSNLQVSATAFEPTAGKQLPDTPKWMSGVRLGYKSGSWYASTDLKHTGSAFSSLVNDESVDAVTLVNATLGYRFADSSFFKKPTIQLNVSNLTDQDYLRINSGSGSLFTTRALGAGGSAPAYYVGAPRFISVTLRSDF